MLLSLVAVCIGLAIGYLRGGRGESLDSLSIRAKGLLVIGVSAALVFGILNPSQPMLWVTMATVALVIFTAANLNRPGMTVVLIGLLCNLASLVANGSVAIGERALLSVDRVDASGQPIVEAPFESTETATSLRPLGKVIPVPGFKAVVSIGDLIMLVGLADVSMHLLLGASIAKTRKDGSTNYFTADSVDTAELTKTSHAATVSPSPAASQDEDALADLREPRVDQPVHAAHAAPAPKRGAFYRPRRRTRGGGIHAATAEAPARSFEPLPKEPVIDLTDTRPIIDLTKSPTDEQLAEFMRRRDAADRRVNHQREKRRTHRPAQVVISEPTPEPNLLSELLH